MSNVRIGILPSDDQEFAHDSPYIRDKPNLAARYNAGEPPKSQSKTFTLDSIKTLRKLKGEARQESFKNATQTVTGHSLKL